VIVVVVLLALLSTSQDQPSLCADRSGCQTMAESALAAKDYERFHDLAWAAYRKGKSNDPQLMLLVARAQSLSGRPLDALVMLERLAALGATTDAATSEDFARVRALPRWNEVASSFSPSAAKAASEDKAANAATEGKAKPAAEEKPKGAKEEKPAKAVAEDKPAEAAAAEKSKAVAEKPKPAAEEKPKPAAEEKPKGAAEEKPSSAAKAASEGKPAPKAPLSFTTVLTPTAIAHDAVSQRFLIADRKARRIAVVDGNNGHVATLVGAQGALGDIGGMAIDSRQGDLWVASATDDGATLHKLQLISGRVISSVPLKIEDPIIAMAHVRGVGLIAADSGGVIWRIRPDGNTSKLAALEYVPSVLASDAQGRLYVSAGTSRLARFTVGSTLRKVDTVEIESSIPADVPFIVIGRNLNFVVPVEGGFELRTVNVK
jgi:hypothetical protein